MFFLHNNNQWLPIFSAVVALTMSKPSLFIFSGRLLVTNTPWNLYLRALQPCIKCLISSSSIINWSECNPLIIFLHYHQKMCSFFANSEKAAENFNSIEIEELVSSGWKKSWAACGLLVNQKPLWNGSGNLSNLFHDHCRCQLNPILY